ncbi:MAG: hypothetical protein KF824_04240 [Fimbriimonadaceae bacterium]|nr:MAG: hypothetical protein KF824_04240 [Fimbriimonadaceae bacterium]
MRSVLILPEALKQGVGSIWEEPPVGLRYFADHGEVFKLSLLEATPELEYVGLSGVSKLPRGPLVLSAFGVDPPERSVQFEMSLLSVSDEGLIGEVGKISSSKLRGLDKEFAKLATKDLTPVFGELTTHGLVWENGSLELGVTAPNDIFGKVYGYGLPEGDGELKLRQLIDDSLNLLDGLEFNRIREGEGLAKANLLWPHSFGFKPNLPNLAIRRGAPGYVWSESIAMQGLSRMVGYQHSDRTGFRKGIHIAESVVKEFKSAKSGLLIYSGLGEILQAGRDDEARFGLEELDRLIFEPWATEIRQEKRSEVVILCPSQTEVGLGIVVKNTTQGSFPFDARVLDDPRLSTQRTFEIVAESLT